MAKGRQRTWTVPGQRTKRRACGFVAIENGKLRAGGMTLAQACERYLAAKSRKRSLANDTRIVKHLKLEFGAETPPAEITAGRISEYKAGRPAAVLRIG